jgi:hypothetical protein
MSDGDRFLIGEWLHETSVQGSRIEAAEFIGVQQVHCGLRH